MRPDLYFIITKNCNFKCRHCYISAGQGKKNTTISEENFRKVIDNLPQISLDLWLTGGEVFTIKDTLYSFLDYISFTNKKREKNILGRINLGIQTNGFWATSDEQTEKILNELIHLDVQKLDITSEDIYHKEQGMKIKNIKRLKIYKRLYPSIPYFYIRGTSKNYIMPLGRAKENGFKLKNLSFEFCKNALDKYNLTIKPDGRVYNCCFQIFNLPGRAIEEPLTNIVKKAKENDRLKILNYEGIKKLAILDGYNKQYVDKLIEQKGKCGLCLKL